MLVPASRTLFRQSKAARLGMVLSIVIGLVLHMAMDYLNSYGIHPFHPFDSRWFYGDMVFILEPVFWVAFGIPLIMMIPKRWFRWLLLAILPGFLLYFTIGGYLLWPSFAALLLLGLVLAVLQKPAQTQGIRALLAAFAVGFCFIAVQAMASRDARETLARILENRHADRTVLDAALTPFPSNPLCWTFVSIESNESAGTYHLRKGLLSLAPEALPVAACPASLLAAPVGAQASREAVFLEHYEGSLQALRSLKEENCRVRAWLRFARAPQLERGTASDMRFSFRSGDNFTTMHLSDTGEDICGAYVPPWDFPREDLLSGSAQK
jgi:inner membrane protein